MRRPSHAATDLIKRSEGLRLHAYRPVPTDPWTIGWGHTAGVHEGMEITVQQAADFLAVDMLGAVRTIYRFCPPTIIDALPQPCFDALVSFVFNVGPQAFRSPKTGRTTDFWRALVGPDRIEVARQMQRWVKAGGQVLPGLVKRRGEEAALWGAGMAAAEREATPTSARVIEALTSAQPDAPRQPPVIEQPGVVVGAAAGAGGIATAAATLSGAGTSVAMNSDRVALLIGLVLILLGAGLMIWMARKR